MPNSPDQLQAKRIELILQQLDQLPTLPAVAVQVVEAAADSKTTVDQVVNLIAADVALTTRLLQLVNSVGKSPTEVATLDRAVVFLGFEAVRGAVLALAIFETFKPFGHHTAF